MATVPTSRDVVLVVAAILVGASIAMDCSCMQRGCLEYWECSRAPLGYWRPV